MGKNKGKGRKKFVAFDSNNLPSQSDSDKATSKTSNKNPKNIKSNRNDDTTPIEKYSVTLTSDIESSADVSTTSNSTKGDESTDTSTKLCGPLDESVLDEFPTIKDNKQNISKCENEISYGNHEPEKVKNGIQNLSVSSHSEDSFNKNSTQFESRGNNEYRNYRKSFNNAKRGGGKGTPYQDSSNFYKETYDADTSTRRRPQGTGYDRRTNVNNTNYNVQQSQQKTKDPCDGESFQYDHRRGINTRQYSCRYDKRNDSANLGDGESFHSSGTQYEGRRGNNTRQYSNRYDKRNETANQGKYLKDKSANYKNSAPLEDLSNFETPLNPNVPETQKPVSGIWDKPVDTNKERNIGQYPPPGNKNWEAQCWDDQNSNNQHTEHHSSQNFAETEIINPGNINTDSNSGTNLVPEDEDWDAEADGYSNNQHTVIQSTQHFSETKSSDAGNNWLEHTQNDSFKYTPHAAVDLFENNFPEKNKRTDNWRSNNRKSLPAMPSHRQDTTKRFSEGNKDDWNKESPRNRNIFDKRSESTDKEYKMFLEEERRNEKVIFVRVEEIQQDLFEMPKDYSLGHCVAEDMRMGSGIAVTFKREFKQMECLLDQRQKQGGLAVLEDEGKEGTRYIYYLITKRESTGKPTYEKFWSSLQKMRNHIRENDVKKLAIPRLGCGLDRLEWDRVKHMIEFLFRDVDVKITVCNFQQNYGQTKQKLQTTTHADKSKKSKTKKKKK
ncbi:putative uncharacterized protein DDB_G0282133 isoform X2 [Anoplophora glabripennis]|uniref:putative uncharacterized protein DDB_G0282133 isoform X2 n=1 Tax=Anoplophora glabripennis TaxID=217634 RepID=UPI00087413AF|nr:putative uncharacterized protein DDB_G0282133 isoform X2 [Anoplophora glabripennis]